MRLAVIAALVLLAACTDPRFGASIDAGPSGVSVSPTIRGTVGGLDVVVRG